MVCTLMFGMHRLPQPEALMSNARPSPHDSFAKFLKVSDIPSCGGGRFTEAIVGDAG